MPIRRVASFAAVAGPPWGAAGLRLPAYTACNFRRRELTLKVNGEVREVLR